MYSILIRILNCRSIRWKYLKNEDGTIYTEDDLLKVQDKVESLLENHLLNDIQVVKNFIITELLYNHLIETIKQLDKYGII